MASKHTQKRSRSCDERDHVGETVPSKPFIKDIKVSVREVRSSKKKKKKQLSDEQADDEAVWYNVKCSVILDIEKSSENRIDVASTKGTWDEDDPGSFMMKRVRKKAFLLVHPLHG